MAIGKRMLLKHPISQLNWQSLARLPETQQISLMNRTFGRAFAYVVSLYPSVLNVRVNVNAALSEFQ